MLPTWFSGLAFAQTHDVFLPYEYRRSSWLVLSQACKQWTLDCSVWSWICGEWRPVVGQSPTAYWTTLQRSIDHHIKRRHPHRRKTDTFVFYAHAGMYKCSRAWTHWWSGDKGGVIDIAVPSWAGAAPPLSAHSITLRRVWGVVKKMKHLFNKPT